MNLTSLLNQYQKNHSSCNTITIIKKGRDKTINVVTNINEQIISEITLLYLKDTSQSIDLNEKYQIDIWKNNKNYMSIHSFDQDKLQKIMKILSYNFIQ